MEQPARANLLIDGRWIEPRRRAPVRRPGSGDVLGTFALATPSHTVAAVDAAHRALPIWAGLRPRERGRILHRVGSELEARKDEIASILSAETGKLASEAAGEVQLAIEYFRWFAEEGRRAHGETVIGPAENKHLLTIPRPRGVAATLTPWNFPVSILARKVAAALAAGCAVVSRPSSTAPLAVHRVAEAIVDAGVVAGAFNLVMGDYPATAEVLVTDERVRVVSFTGSTGVGKAIARAAASTLKVVTLELGGDAPFLVFDDADINDAVDQASIAKYRNNGQSCIAMNRLLVQKGIAHEFIDAFVGRSMALTLGDPREPATQLGPVISEDAAGHIEGWIDHSAADGLKVYRSAPTSLPRQFVRPAIVLEPERVARRRGTEIFGPAVGVTVFGSDEDGIELASATPYGLAAYVMTRDLSRAFQVADALKFGVIGVNDPTPTSPEVPLGGFGDSGYGKEGGHAGMAEFLNEQFLSIRPQKATAIVES
jgi:succinate-semialdehyde dehydrogenase / glutarate-semialdehyde dehydrogenase